MLECGTCGSQGLIPGLFHGLFCPSFVEMGSPSEFEALVWQVRLKELPVSLTSHLLGYKCGP